MAPLVSGGSSAGTGIKKLELWYQKYHQGGMSHAGRTYSSGGKEKEGARPEERLQHKLF
jgi:hypothetical protein